MSQSPAPLSPLAVARTAPPHDLRAGAPGPALCSNTQIQNWSQGTWSSPFYVPVPLNAVGTRSFICTGEMRGGRKRSTLAHC